MNAAAQKKIVANKVLVTGASGLLGVAAIEKFLSAGWEVVGVSRRKPELPSGREVRFLPVDLRDEDAARAAFEPLADVTHIAYTALHEKPELVAGWSSKEQIETNTAMLRNVVEPIVRTASDFQHISIQQGTKIYGVHLRPIPIPARERDARKDHANFFFDHEDYVRERGARHGFTYTALRPQLVTRPTPGALNIPCDRYLRGNPPREGGTLWFSWRSVVRLGSRRCRPRRGRDGLGCAVAPGGERSVQHY
jgi:nucleoside-diphosphate-sugar epimerase